MSFAIHQSDSLIQYQFVAVLTEMGEKLLLSRKSNSDLWQLQGGLIKEIESPSNAAKRELFDAFGVSALLIEPLCDCRVSLSESGETKNGMVFRALIQKSEQILQSDILEIGQLDSLPQDLAYPVPTSELIEYLFSQKAADDSETRNIKLISEMEYRLNRAKRITDSFSKALDEFSSIQKDIELLSEYYGSEIWFSQLKSYDERKLPINLKCGVLSEDAIYDLLTDNRSLLKEASQLKKLSPKEQADLQIKKATADDLDNILKYDHHITKAELASSIALGRVYVLTDNEQLAGWLRYNLFWDNTPFLNMIYLLDEYRGQGYGSILLKQWEADRKAEGFSVLMTSTAADETAQFFYRKHGYEDIGGFTLPGDPYELIFMKKLN